MFSTNDVHIMLDTTVIAYTIDIVHSTLTWDEAKEQTPTVQVMYCMSWHKQTVYIKVGYISQRGSSQSVGISSVHNMGYTPTHSQLDLGDTSKTCLLFLNTYEVYKNKLITYLMTEI